MHALMHALVCQSIHPCIHAYTHTPTPMHIGPSITEDIRTSIDTSIHPSIPSCIPADNIIHYTLHRLRPPQVCAKKCAGCCLCGAGGCGDTRTAGPPTGSPRTGHPRVLPSGGPLGDARAPGLHTETVQTKTCRQRLSGKSLLGMSNRTPCI